MIDERYVVDTPEQVTFGYTVAGIGSRFLAAIIDTLLLLFKQIVLVLVLLVTLNAVSEQLTGEAADSMRSVVLAVWGILSFVFLWGYYLFFELQWNGQTPGKRAIGLRVVREGGRPITFVASAIRNLVRVIDFLPSLYGLGVLVMFVDKHSRRLGDLAGGTLVVKDHARVTLDTLTTQDRFLPPSSSAYVGALTQVDMLSKDDYSLVQEFLRRRRDMAEESRIRLGKQLAHSISARLGVSVAYGDQETFLESVAYAYRQQYESTARSG